MIQHTFFSSSVDGEGLGIMLLLDLRTTIALINIERLGHKFVGEIPGNRRAILGMFPTNDRPKRFNSKQGYRYVKGEGCRSGQLPNP
jgi:hypothetical protein